MNPKPNSFAYCYAKQLLRGKTPKYTPWVSLMAGLVLAVTPFLHGNPEPLRFVIPLLLIYTAVHSWLERGKQEAFQEAESIIEELRASGKP